MRGFPIPNSNFQDFPVSKVGFEQIHSAQRPKQDFTWRDDLQLWMLTSLQAFRQKVTTISVSPPAWGYSSAGRTAAHWFSSQTHGKQAEKFDQAFDGPD